MYCRHVITLGRQIRTTTITVSRNRLLFQESIQCIQQIASFCIWLFGDHVYLSQKFHKTVLFNFTDNEIEILEMQSQNQSPGQVRIRFCFCKNLYSL